ncbi:MOSC domain-containing protein [Rhodococcus sp. BP-252]|uniref:Molybdenum cofactor sulfurase n=1 Tax=Rhodococcoides kyotonense TaxID=398843 RepID=A0A177YGW8_9NOCA|nr:MULTISPECIES: MOSC domain-containing protein [Rhodococcus]MBY6412746.1 MOSC domain-containing protein [Rhodococcus sp. BP-320]MBY6417456.1 MOSC domain-containing protein [Rhodococcus sp. BP-321]MBY6421766.1 MOSC domain-containing protein [Rhodococcus sp. BP-324]MBY6427505.1 MOSC domain-containing protein [Rhodococcus sp. BP-323]MBY6432644.1 MOSC domain-containing protein [Rhodococcus sp. BP-322]
MTGRIEAVCVVHADVPFGRRAVVDSAIDKRPAVGPVDVGEHGLSGDYSRDTKFHGGGDQALYAYDESEAARWASELNRDVPAGWFGENLRTSGVAVTDAVIGSRWRVGTTLLEVTIPRRPCGTFARWVDEPRWVRRFTERGDVGAYLRVIETGVLTAGDAVVVEDVPAHGVTVRHLFEGTDVDGLTRLLESPNLATKVERDVRAALGVGSKS